MFFAFKSEHGSELCRHILSSVPLRSLNVSLITHLQYLVLTCAFFSCWAKHQLVTLPWLTVCSACLPPLSLQRPWVSSWPVVVPHPDTASSKSSQECASTAVTQTCVTAPPPGTQAHSTTSVHCSASCCWGCGCDMERNKTLLDYGRNVWYLWLSSPLLAAHV